MLPSPITATCILASLVPLRPASGFAAAGQARRQGAVPWPPGIGQDADNDEETPP
jgi:hypothetical protein